MKTAVWLVTIGICVLTLAPSDVSSEKQPSAKLYQLVGCFVDNSTRAIQPSIWELSGKNIIEQCVALAFKRGYLAVGIQNGSECHMGAQAHVTYNKFGRASDNECENGLGGVSRNSVYFIARLHFRHVGCFRDNQTRAIKKSKPLFSRDSAITDCAAFAVSIVSRAFGVQMGNNSKGRCWVDTDAHKTYERYGQIDDNECIDGRGGNWKSSIYLLASQLRAPFTEAPRDPTYVSNGSDARVQWNFNVLGGFLHVEILREVSGSWLWLLRKDNNGSITINSNLPQNLTSRVAIEGNATLVISNFSNDDRGKYECRLVQSSGETTTEAPVQLLLTDDELHTNSCVHSNQSFCSHICISSDTLPRCGCRRGYQLEDGKCVDVNECTRNDTCAYKCTNYDGSVSCSCKNDQDKFSNSSYQDWWSNRTWWGSLTQGTKRECRLKRCWKQNHENVTWPTTEVYKTTQAACPIGKTGYSLRECKFESGKGTWATPNFSKCVVPSAGAENVTSNKSSGTTKSESVHAMDNLINSLVNATLSPAESEKHMKEFASNLGNFVDGEPSTEDIALAVEKSEQLGSVIVKGMRRSGNIKDPVTVQVSTSALEMGVNILPPDNNSAPAPVVFPGAGSSERVSLPGSLLKLAQNKRQDGVAISSILLPNVAVASNPKSKRTLNSGIIATTVLFVDAKEFQNLEQPLVISLPHKEKQKVNSKALCAYQNVSISPPEWASRGCKVNSTNSTYTVCHCYHATSFAVLMDVHGVYEDGTISHDHKLALSILSIVGCSIALICFIVVLLAYIVSRRKTETVNIHKNFAVAEILALFFFLISYSAVPVRRLCYAVALLLHYSLLSVFFWMFVEGLNIHRGLVKVFLTSSRMNVYLVIGWGAPVLIVAITAGITQDDYIRDDFCWLSHDLIWAFAGPAALILLVNFVILFVAVKVMVRRTQYKVKQQAKVKPDPASVSKEIKAAFKTLVVLTPMLGLTWVLGYMTVKGTSLVFQYLFTIVNSLQGLYFLFAQCFFDDEIRKSTKQASSRLRRSLSTSLTRSKSKRSNSSSSAVSPAPHSKSFMGAWNSPRPNLSRKASSSLSAESAKPPEVGPVNNASQDTKF